MKTTMIIILCAFACARAYSTQYSCLSIITEAKAIGKWQAIKAWIDESGLSDEWGKCSYVSDEHPQYAAITNALVSGGVLTIDEIDTIIKKSEDTALSDSLLTSLYRRDMSTEYGRTKWHGGRVKTEEDMTNLVQTFTYEDGYRFSIPFRISKGLSVAARFSLEKKRQEEDERKRLSQLPPGLGDVQKQRQSNASTTNEVTVHYGKTVDNGCTLFK